MVFYCQRNCYSTEYSTSVVSCKPSKTEYEVDGKQTLIDCYEIIFEDTVFFPEGGGQPYDKGHVNDIPVIKVLRNGGDAIHFMLQGLEVGKRVTQVIDWERRYDHMQQHSAQHLITALVDNAYNCITKSWNLGEKISSIELDIPMLSEEQIVNLEENCNLAIRQCTPVLIEEFDATDPKLREVRTRGLPDDVIGPVRVITIEGVESNMCCGTHVKNLSDLQAIKILHYEKGKKGKTNLYFVAGNRILKYLKECVGRERELNLLLHSNPSDHARLVEKSKKELKQCMKSLNEALRDLAVAEAFEFNHKTPRPSLLFHHRRDGDFDYLSALISAIDDEDVTKVLTTGEDSGTGVLVIHGRPERVNKISKRVCEILDGKGGGKTRFTAKIKKPHKRNEAETYVRETLGLL